MNCSCDAEGLTFLSHLQAIHNEPALYRSSGPTVLRLDPALPHRSQNTLLGRLRSGAELRPHDEGTHEDRR